jgi:acetylglutamate kinase
MKELLVVKIGGNIIDNEKALAAFLADFAAINRPKLLVHGGGKLATEVSAALGIQAQFIDGRRITDEAALKVVTMVYAGWINKRITASLQANGCKSIGLSGADANLLPAVKRPVKDIDYGFVGDLVSAGVNTDFLNQLLQQGITPVIAPVTADAQGQLLNINADTVARTIAEVMCSIYITDLVYCFEKNGLLSNVEDDSSVRLWW